MNPRSLRTFLSVQKHLSYTRAAEEVFLSQPAVSRQIHQLEEDLGVALFEQIGKSLRLTDAGRTLVIEAEKILGTMDRAAEAVRAHPSVARGVLRVGASTTPGLYLLPGPLGRFHQDAPEVEICYLVENSRRIERRIVRNELDLGFVGSPLSNEDLELEALVAAGIGFSFMSLHGLKHELRSGQLQRLPLSGLDLRRQIFLVRHRGKQLSAVGEAFASIVRRAIGSHEQATG